MVTGHPREGHPRGPQAARLLVAAYPPAWRSRYGDELLALLADGGLSAGVACDLLRGALAAWWRLPGHLLDGASRRRTTLSVLFAVWVGLAGASLVFGQLYEDQGLRAATPGHPFTAAATGSTP